MHVHASLLGMPVYTPCVQAFMKINDRPQDCALLQCTLSETSVGEPSSLTIGCILACPVIDYIHAKSIHIVVY